MARPEGKLWLILSISLKSGHMTLRELIKEARKHLQDPEEDGDFGPEGRNARGAAPEGFKPSPLSTEPCGPGMVRQRRADGSSSCVSLRGSKR